MSASEGSVWARRKETFERVGRKRLSASERAQAQARERRGHTTPPGHGGWSQLFLGFLPIDISTAGDIPSQDDGWGQEVHQNLNLPSREGLKVRRDLPKRTVDLTTVNLRMRKHGIILPTKRPEWKIFKDNSFTIFVFKFNLLRKKKLLEWKYFNTDFFTFYKCYSQWIMTCWAQYYVRVIRLVMKKTCVFLMIFISLGSFITKSACCQDFIEEIILKAETVSLA